LAIIAVSIAPLGEGASVSKYVTETQRVLREDGRLKYRLDPMFTTIQGDIDTCLDVIKKMHEAVFAAGAQRVETLIKIDDRRDKPLDMDDKIRSVEVKLRK
jgi:uncharacterized protein (TIGR00106 family)